MQTKKHFFITPHKNGLALKSKNNPKPIRVNSSQKELKKIAINYINKCSGGYLSVQNKKGKFIENIEINNLGFHSEIIKRANKVCHRQIIKNTSNLDPIFKWTGGKRKEIKHFEKFFPEFVLNQEKYTYVEPFVGAGAVYFYLNNVNGKNIINDFDESVVNFYKEFFLSDKKFISELNRIGKITDHNTLEKEYYAQRNKDKNNGLLNVSNIDRAIRFFVVNQLAFSGMRRFNSSGEFNVPFGHYKGINTEIIHSTKHRALLGNTEILSGDFEQVMKNNDSKNTFIFLDPPYTRVFKEYSSNNSFGEKDHLRLAQTIKSMKNAKVMMIIDKSDFTENLYKGLIKSKYSLKYGVNIKNRFNTAVEHLIITNY